MGIVDQQAKDAFATKTKSQNLGRLLLRVVQHVFQLLNSPALCRTVVDGVWSEDQSALDRTDVRLYLWQAAREGRELVLKALALISCVESTDFRTFADNTIDLTSRMLDCRESFRKRILEFSVIQWPPHGLCPPLQPPWPVEVAMDVLLGGGSFPRLPVMLEDSIKQINEADPASVLQIPFLATKFLLAEERLSIRQRVEEEVLAMWSMSMCPRSLARMVCKEGKIHFSVANEFSVVAIYDFQRLQIIEASILVGSSCGLEISPLLNLGYQNILRQGLGLLEARHGFLVDKTKRKLRELGRELMDLKLRERELRSSKVIADKDTDKTMLPCDMLDDQESKKLTAEKVLSQHITKLEAEIEEVMERLHAIQLYESSDTSQAKGSRLTAGTCFDERDAPLDYFAELFYISRWLTAGLVLNILRDQILRARSCSSSFPGGIFKFAETGVGNLRAAAKGSDDNATSDAQPSAAPDGRIEGSIASASVDGRESSSVTAKTKPQLSYHGQLSGANIQSRTRRALDVLFLSHFDFTCGGLLTPLLVVLLTSPSLLPYRLTSMFLPSKTASEEEAKTARGLSPVFGPSLVQSVTTMPELSLDGVEAGVPADAFSNLKGSGAILRFSIDDEFGVWDTILWPLSPLMKLLDKADVICRQQAGKATMSLAEALRKSLPLNFEEVREIVAGEPSYSFIKKFTAKDLDISSWMRHAVSCLSTLTFATLAAYLKHDSKCSFYTSDVDLRAGASPGGELSAHRSITIRFFGWYAVVLQLDLFDGSPRVSFRVGNGKGNIEGSGTVKSWIRWPGAEKNMEAEVIAGLRSSAAGLAGLVRVLPHFKFLAFVDLVRQAIAARSFIECRGMNVALSLLDKPSAASSNTDIRMTTLGLEGPWVDPNITNPITSRSEKFFIQPPAEAPELTRILQKMSQMGSGSFLSATMTFAVDEWPLEESGVIVRVLLAVTLTNAWEISETHVVVLRCMPGGDKTIVANLKIEHRTYALSDGANFDTGNLFMDYWSVVEDSLKEMSTQLTHVAAVASLAPEAFPFYLRSLGHGSTASNEEGISSFKFRCAPSSSTGWASVGLFWHPAYCLGGEHLGSILSKESWMRGGRSISISTTLESIAKDNQPKKGTVTVKAILAKEDGIRMPAFYGGDQKLEDGGYLSVENELTIKLNSIYHITSNSNLDSVNISNVEVSNEVGTLVESSTWFSCDSIVLTTTYTYHPADKEKFSVAISSSYARCRELQRASLLRTDLKILKALPTSLEVSWQPFVFAVPSHVGSLTPQSRSLKIPPVRFLWHFKKESVEEQFSVSFKLAVGVLVIVSEMLYTSLNENKSQLERCFSRFTSAWQMMRLIMSTFELHAAINMIEITRAEIRLPPAAFGTKLAPPLISWSRVSDSPFGSEEIRFVFHQSKEARPAVPNVIDDILVQFAVLPKTAEYSKDQDSEDSEVSPLCLSVQIVVNSSPTLAASGVMTRSANETVMRLTEGLSLPFQSGAAIPMEDRCSPSLLGMYIPEEIQHSTLDLLLSQSPPSIQHRIYFFPGRLFGGVIVPLIDSLASWANGVSSAVAVDNRHVISRTGVLLLTKQPGQQESHENNTRKTTMGILRWRHSTAPPKPNTEPPSSVKGECVPEHQLELHVVPSIGSVLTSKYRRQPAEPRDPVYSGTVTLGHCGTLASASPYSQVLTSYVWYNLLRRFATDTQHAEWVWKRDFNFLTKPSTSFGFFSASSSNHSPIEPQSSLQRYVADEVDKWRSLFSSATLPVQDGNPQKKLSITPETEAVAKRVAESNYLDLHPCALVLPYELISSNSSLSVETKVALGKFNPEVDRSRKRGRNPSEEVEPSKKLRSLTSVNEALLTTSSDDVAEPSASFIMPICASYVNLSWESPLCSHGAMRADGKQVEIQFTAALDLRSIPALAEGTVTSKYFRLYNTQLTTNDFPFLVRFFQCFTLLPLADLTAVLDLSARSLELHTAYFKRLLRAMAEHTTPEPPPHVPFLQLEFRKAPTNRVGQSPLLEIEIVVWQSLPFLGNFVSTLNGNILREFFSDGFSDSFPLTLAIPLPAVDPKEVLVNGAWDLVSLGDMASQVSSLPPSYSLNIQRPLSKALQRVFVQNSFSSLKKVLTNKQQT